MSVLVRQTQLSLVYLSCRPVTLFCDVPVKRAQDPAELGPRACRCERGRGRTRGSLGRVPEPLVFCCLSVSPTVVAHEHAEQ